MKLEFTAVFRRVANGYVAFVEELPGANTQSATLDEARANLREAVDVSSVRDGLCRKWSWGRPASDAVAAVTAAVERTTGHKILIGTVPLDLMSDTRMEQGSTNEFARDILLRTCIPLPRARQAAPGERTGVA